MNLARMSSVAFGAVAVLAAGSIAYGGPSAARSGPTEFTLNLKHLTEHEIDNPPKGGGPGVGDAIVFHKSLSQGGKVVGHVVARAQAVTGGRNPRITVEGMVTLKGGTLAVAETFRINDQRHNIAITGGTGAYEGASGSMSSGLPGQDHNDVLFRVLQP